MDNMLRHRLLRHVELSNRRSQVRDLASLALDKLSWRYYCCLAIINLCFVLLINLQNTDIIIFKEKYLKQHYYESDCVTLQMGVAMTHTTTIVYLQAM